MPIGQRHRLINWALENNSYIIEDDYDSELRYFGKPVPAMQGLENAKNVVYLGSFSSTLFASAKISYMVLPAKLIGIFDEIKSDYSQTCSKTEQVALALFMKNGWYQTGIKKMRRLYSQKLNKIISIFENQASGFVLPFSSSSGINIIVKVNSKKSANKLCEEARTLKIHAEPLDDVTESSEATSVIIYYNQIPLEEFETAIDNLIKAWKN